MRPSESDYESIPFRMHPRVFSALGADLVTNDVVAVIELVKNAYDAFADNVWLRFGCDQVQGDFIEIEDDGCGMTRQVIEDVWCMVATPFREQNPVARSGGKIRRVAGQKGLGRLSVARLGDHLRMLTKAPDSDCFEVEVNWSEVSASDSMDTCAAYCRRFPGSSPFGRSGTRLRILSLKADWDEDRMADLEENLARLISPFVGAEDFAIFLRHPGVSDAEQVRIESPEFLSRPKYSIFGEVSAAGRMTGAYNYSPIRDRSHRKAKRSLTWQQVCDTVESRGRTRLDSSGMHCGPFSFEIRAWDIGSGDTHEIAEKFDFQENQVRKTIRAHKGISVYRDGILVLPKSENARDWLGLDLRRISKIGTRLSTSQIVGYVSISAESNPGIKDTSDRERLVSNIEVTEFEEWLKAIVSLLEDERDTDRAEPERQMPMENLFEAFSADELAAEVETLAREGAQAAEVVPFLQTHTEALASARAEIQERLLHYSRVATVGTIALMLVHEIRNRTTAVGSLLELVKSRFKPFKDKELAQAYQQAERAVIALERLADTFSPLASRSFRRRKRDAILEERIKECLELKKGELQQKRIKCRVPGSETRVAVDPGELDSILLNLIDNAAYWLGQVQNGQERELTFRIASCEHGNRVKVFVADTGPGIDEDSIEKVFIPGFTRKPEGIGMGLTVASELVAEYGGRMAVAGTAKGASFTFDLPVKRN